MNVEPAANSWEARAMKHVLAGFTDLPTMKERGPVVLTHGEGARVFDVHGRSWLDANSGLWNVVAGFDHEGLHRAGFKWDLMQASWIADHLDTINDPARRADVKRPTALSAAGRGVSRRASKGRRTIGRDA